MAAGVALWLTDRIVQLLRRGKRARYQLRAIAGQRTAASQLQEREQQSRLQDL